MNPWSSISRTMLATVWVVEADAAGDVGAGHGGVEADRLEDDAPVIGPAEFLVGAAERHPDP